jgi:Mg2+ and Co2+ transporter CorA
MDMARPELPDIEKDRIENIYKIHRGYPPKSFQEALSTVADLAERVTKETVLDEKLPLRYEVRDHSSATRVHITTEPDSEIQYSYGSLKTPDATVQLESVYATLEEIQGVKKATDRGGDPIDVYVEKDPDRSFDKIVDDIFGAIARIIQQEEDRIEQIEERADQYASEKE